MGDIYSELDRAREAGEEIERKRLHAAMRQGAYYPVGPKKWVKTGGAAYSPVGAQGLAVLEIGRGKVLVQAIKLDDAKPKRDT